MSEIEIARLIHELSALRAQFGRVNDGYRQSRIDVAINQLEECQEVKDEYVEANAWPDPAEYTNE